MLTIKSYYQMPSDCDGDGYDIALAPHVDDQARVELHPDRAIYRTELRAGVNPNNGQGGWFCGYKVREITLDDGGRDLLRNNEAIKCVVQWVQEARGAWKHARGRGRIRVALVDTSKHHRQINHHGYLQTLSDSGSLCFDYPGGVWGYGDSLRRAEALANAVNALIAEARQANADIPVEQIAA